MQRAGFAQRVQSDSAIALLHAVEFALLDEIARLGAVGGMIEVADPFVVGQIAGV